MKRTFIVPLLGTLFLMLLFGGCTDDQDDDLGRETNAYLLCKNVWVDNFNVSDYEYCHQELIFRVDGSGQNYREFYQRDAAGRPFGPAEIVSAPFRWYWDDECQEAIVFVYSNNSRSYFENVWIRQHYLSGRLDGTDVVYIDSKLLE